MKISMDMTPAHPGRTDGILHFHHNASPGRHLTALGHYGAILFMAIILAAATSFIACADEENEIGANGSFLAGWAEADLTPDEPVMLAGQFHARVSEGVMDPVTATALALESIADDGVSQHVVMVSCDFSTLPDCLRDSVREHLRRELPELDPQSVLFSATHTHSAPFVRIKPRYVDPDGAEIEEHPYGIELPAMNLVEYADLASRRIADAVISAWHQRAPAGVTFGLGHAVVGRNRIMAYKDGRSRMYGNTNTPAFSHVEGYEDHSVNILATYSPGGELTGLIVNLACPSQVSEQSWRVSADFWHETREEVRRRFGDGDHVFLLAQHSAAGDQSARVLVDRRAEERMWRLAGRSQREEIAVRIADAVERTLPLIEPEIQWNPRLIHHVEVVELPRRKLSEQDVRNALREAQPHQARYETMLDEIENNPDIRRQTRWYRDISRAYRLSLRGKNVERRFEAQQRDPNLPVEVHAVRLGDAVFVTNPFELYLDYGMQIKARSPAAQTFIVQLAGPGSYVPTARSIAGGAYGAVPASTEIGVEGGNALVEWSVGILQNLWEE